MATARRRANAGRQLEDDVRRTMTYAPLFALATIEPDEQGAVDPTQMQPTARRALLQDVELMSQYPDFGFQPRSRLEEVAQHTDEQEADCNHPTILF